MQTKYFQKKKGEKTVQNKQALEKKKLKLFVKQSVLLKHKLILFELVFTIIESNSVLKI